MLGFIVYLDKKSLIISKCPIPTQSRVFVHGKQSKFVSSILIEYYEDINVVVSYIQSLYLLPYHSQSGSSHTFPRNKDTILMMLIIVYKCNDILVAVLRNKCYDIFFLLICPCQPTKTEIGELTIYLLRRIFIFGAVFISKLFLVLTTLNIQGW